MKIGKEQARWIYKTMNEIRCFEEKVHKIFSDGKIPGFVHLYVGEEAVATGVMSQLNDDDYITSTHRGHGHAIAKGCDLNGMMAEIMVKRDGLGHGKGGFYFTDFRGYSTQSLGGVYYVSPDFKTVTPVIQNISVANGIALSTDEKVLWVTETTTNRLHRIVLEDDGVTIAPFGTTIPYYFTGHEGPDSCCIDSDDNVYVAMYGQGRVLVFNKRGYPIGQILMPGRDKGKMLRSTHPQFIPGTNQLIICTNDIENNFEGGSMLYTVNGFAKGHESYQFQ